MHSYADQLWHGDPHYSEDLYQPKDVMHSKLLDDEWLADSARKSARKGKMVKWFMALTPAELSDTFEQGQMMKRLNRLYGGK